VFLRKSVVLLDSKRHAFRSLAKERKEEQKSARLSPIPIIIILHEYQKKGLTQSALRN
jgi:hypothetical protein